MKKKDVLPLRYHFFMSFKTLHCSWNKCDEDYMPDLEIMAQK